MFSCSDLWQHATPLLEFIINRYGDRRLDSLGGSYGWSVRYAQVEDYEELGISTVREYLSAYRDKNQLLPYLRHISINRAMPDLHRWLKLPQAFTPNWANLTFLDRLSGPELFVGQAGTTFGHLHQDQVSVHVGFVQLEGEKEFLMLPPEDGQYLYRIPGRQFPYQMRNSRVRYVDFDDRDRFPLLQHTRPRRILLKAGQALFLPANWWHTTYNHTDSVSYSIRIVNGSNALPMIGDYLGGVPRTAARFFKGMRSDWFLTNGGQA